MRRATAGRVWSNTAAVVLFVFFAFPVYWMVTTAFKPDLDIISKTPVFVPFDGTLAHFTKAVHAAGFWTLVRNSFTVTLGAVLLSLIVSMLAAFALARMRFRGRKAFILMIMVAQMAPWEVMTISVYMIVREQDQLNSLVPLILFYMMMVMPLTVWTLRGFIAAVPKELEESALVDGCTRRQAFFRVVFPLLAPGLMSTSLFGYITAWNEFPLVLILNKDNGQTLPLWLTEFQTNFGNDWGATMAASTLFTLPVVVVFLVLQRKAVGGLTAGAVKG
ncbi:MULTISPECIES: carbohydrate ABC transporter permease [Streptomycetaceae]|uniref:Sugar transporter integral membrane protein n=1 Tax=Streptantibioticus cattleyicolor (strain ATCC 35852 / DSM 46488 / JCM 4925 / NBRC 14057 / NRRL 8057) TaxID=1003195 RepID=F8K4U0_STREN|nr:carbohydrate ABC transporter permease [Streptantibioticus cattleyicolor]AEW96455.1 sugar transporter integral membrane protein [Streptantibioticus cattleyicolor NRRL 8057 = DSM 46488]MYS60961.1 ABC transporter permease subunit [Streptomyces sp. SID5468]CCB76789.1 Sugar transporter integral membrane protein [Streptantibioticus cattleyicolor NRRL 8057 = DSM 46488]